MVDIGRIAKIANELSQWFGLFEKAPQEIKDKLPMFLGLSLKDERIWDQLWTQLKEEERKLITNFLATFEVYERDHFRHVVVGIPSGQGEPLITGTGKDAKITTKPGRDFALEFLQELAKLIEKEGIAEAKRQCEMGGTIVKNPLMRQILSKWTQGNKWFETKVFSYLGITKWEEFSLKKLDTTTAAKLRAARLERRNPQVAREKVEYASVLDVWTFGFNKTISSRGSKIKNAGLSRFNLRNWFSEKNFRK